MTEKNGERKKKKKKCEDQESTNTRRKDTSKTRLLKLKGPAFPGVGGRPGQQEKKVANSRLHRGHATASRGGRGKKKGQGSVQNSMAKSSGTSYTEVKEGREKSKKKRKH